MNDRGLGTICHIWELARVPIVLAGTKNLYDLFLTSNMTEDVRDQLVRRVKIFYGLPSLSNQEGVKIIKQSLKDATDEDCARLLGLTKSIYSYVVDAIELVIELRKSHKNWSLEKLIAAACSKVIGASD